jgi:hypothetical protein
MFTKMTTADDRETVIGKATYRQNIYYMQPARATFFRRTVLICSHAATQRIILCVRVPPINWWRTRNTSVRIIMLCTWTSQTQTPVGVLPITSQRSWLTDCWCLCTLQCCPGLHPCQLHLLITLPSLQVHTGTSRFQPLRNPSRAWNCWRDLA